MAVYFLSPCNAILDCFVLLTLLGFLLKASWCSGCGGRRYFLGPPAIAGWPFLGEVEATERESTYATEWRGGRHRASLWPLLQSDQITRLPGLWSRSWDGQTFTALQVLVSNNLGCGAAWGSQLGLCWASPLLVPWPKRTGFWELTVGRSKFQPSPAPSLGGMGSKTKFKNSSDCGSSGPEVTSQSTFPAFRALYHCLLNKF